MPGRKANSPKGVVPLVATDRKGGAPLHRQLYAAYREAILDGRLQRGQRLPSTRALAEAMAGDGGPDREVCVVGHVPPPPL